MTNAEVRKELFDLYSKNLALYHPDFQGIFLCPLCQETFGQDALEGPDPRISLAHIIPASLGGRTCTLTCTDCNNRFGTELEAHLSRFLNHKARMEGHGRIPAVRLRGPFGNVGVEVQFSRDPSSSHSVFVVEKQSNPKDAAKLKEFFDEWTKKPVNVDLRFSFRVSVRHRHTKLAFYHAALLLMFHYFGYEYVLRPNVEPLRKQLLSPEEDVHKTQVLMPGALSETIWFHNPRWGVMFLNDKPGILVFLQVQPSVGPSLAFAVVLPGLENAPMPDFAVGSDFRGDVIPFMPHVAMAEAWIAHKLWRALRTRHSG